jgi:hypothetical protein
VKTKFTWHKGRDNFLNDDKKHFIIFTFELYQERGISVSAKLLELDLMRQYPDLQDIPARNIIRGVRLYLKVDENITCRWITHMAQNVRFHEAIILDFVDYCNRQIFAGRYGADQIVNMDETNLDFDIDPRYTLERKGERSVNSYIIDSSSRLTAVMAVSMSGVKLPAYVIFKGVRGGQVWAEV